MRLVMIYREAFRLKIWVDYVGFFKVLVYIHGTIVAECKGGVLAWAEKWSPSTESSKPSIQRGFQSRQYLMISQRSRLAKELPSVPTLDVY